MARKLPLILTLALREQRNGLKDSMSSSRVFALGRRGHTGVGALGDALRSSFESSGEALLAATWRCHVRIRPSKARPAVAVVAGARRETATLRAMLARSTAASRRCGAEGCRPGIRLQALSRSATARHFATPFMASQRRHRAVLMERLG